MQIIDNKALLVETDDPEKILSEIRQSALVDDNKVAVKWTLDNAAALAAMGIEDVPSPILRDYQWSGRLTPFDHQRTTASFLSLRKKAFCFSEAGTGKTASVIWAADYLMKLGRVKRVLVLCPLSIMKSAWQQDLFRFAMHRSVAVAHGDAKQRKKIIEEGAEFVIINFDGVEIVKDTIAAGNFDMVVVDEATAYKTVSTNRWKVFKALSDQIPYLWMLTGTPAAQSPLDAYGLAKLVNPENSPRSFSQFRDKIMYRVTQYKWVPREGATEIAHKMLQPAIRFEKRACLDLPPVLHTEREAPLTPMQIKFYKELKHKMVTQAAGEQITSVNAAANLNKLLQISGGAVYTDTGATVEFDVSNRLNVVLEAIEEASAKVLVFVPYTHTINLLKNTLDKAGIESEIINGAVSPNKRTDIVHRFQTSPKTRVLILQPAAASHGLTLTEADTIIWAGPVTSCETYLQANARIDRPGQKNNMTIIHIVGSDVERKLYDMLKNNINNHNKLVELYRQEIGK